MKPLRAPDLARRAFLQRAAALSATGAAAPLALNLSLLAEAAADTAPADYKALVCVFLHGGNDHANTLVPVDDDGHAAYARLRGALATPRERLAATTLVPAAALPGGRRYALAPELAPLLPLWSGGRLAVQLNIGPLLQPTTRAQALAASVPLPPKLFSHNDQQSIWQSGLPEGATSGWGGRMGDLLLSANGSAQFTAISVSGNAVFLSGRDVIPYQTGSSGPVAVKALQQATLYGSAAAQQALQALITGTRTHLIEEAYNAVVRRSIAAESTVSAALAAAPALATPFGSGTLSGQLAMVARLLAARAGLGAQRQVFFVSLGGFDTHDDQLARHPALLAELAAALAAFDAALAELGLAERVTTFTASDFGRTLTPNGDGTDHGWGSHHLLLGGAVRGGRFHGSDPAIDVDGPDDVGQGRLLPSTSVDQLAATLARWFGVADGSLPTVLPRIGGFATRDLGYFG